MMMKRNEDYVDEGGYDKYAFRSLASGDNPEILEKDAMEAFKETESSEDIPEEAATELVDNTSKGKTEKWAHSRCHLLTS